MELSPALSWFDRVPDEPHVRSELARSRSLEALLAKNRDILALVSVGSSVKCTGA